MAVRDMDIAAELMGIRLLRTKLLAFAVSSFYCGVAGAMMMFLWYGGGEANDAFNINQSLPHPVHGHHRRAGQPDRLLLRRGLHLLLPIILKFGLPAIGIPIAGATAEHLTLHDRRRPDHLLPDRRAARPRAALADRRSRSCGLAVPLLTAGRRTAGKAARQEA
jgi:hypothetical protein